MRRTTQISNNSDIITEIAYTQTRTQSYRDNVITPWHVFWWAWTPLAGKHLHNGSRGGVWQNHCRGLHGRRLNGRTTSPPGLAMKRCFRKRFPRMRAAQRCGRRRLRSTMGVLWQPTIGS